MAVKPMKFLSQPETEAEYQRVMSALRKAQHDVIVHCMLYGSGFTRIKWGAKKRGGRKAGKRCPVELAGRTQRAGRR